VEECKPLLDGATPIGGADPFGTVSAAPYGSALILPISFGYITMMGSKAWAYTRPLLSST